MWSYICRVNSTHSFTAYENSKLWAMKTLRKDEQFVYVVDFSLYSNNCLIKSQSNISSAWGNKSLRKLYVFSLNFVLYEKTWSKIFLLKFSCKNQKSFLLRNELNFLSKTWKSFSVNKSTKSFLLRNKLIFFSLPKPEKSHKSKFSKSCLFFFCRVKI